MSSANDLTLIDTVTDVDQLQKACQKHQPDVILLALNLTLPPCADIFGYFQSYCPTTNILVLFTDDDEAYLQQLVDYGIVGGIHKSDTPEKLVEAVRATAQGETWFSSSLLPNLINLSNDEHAMELTDRELEVLQLVAAEQTDKKIAKELGIAVRTVRYHLEGIFNKLGVTTRGGAAAEAVKRKLIE